MSVGIFELVAGSTLAAGDVLAFVDISDNTQAPQGSLLKITVTNLFATVPVPIVVTSAGASALAVGPNGATNPVLRVDASTASAATGLTITGAAAGSGVALVARSSGTNEALTLNAKGSGTIGIGSVSTGAVTITPATTITGALTLSASGTSLAAAGSISVVSGKKVSLNAGITSYWYESVAGTLTAHIGSTDVLSFSETVLSINAWAQIGASASHVGFFGSTGAVKQTISGSRAGNAALAALLTALAGMNLLTDSTTA